MWSGNVFSVVMKMLSVNMQAITVAITGNNESLFQLRISMSQLKFSIFTLILSLFFSKLFDYLLYNGILKALSFSSNSWVIYSSVVVTILFS